MQATIVTESGHIVMRVSGTLAFEDNKEWRSLAEDMLQTDASRHVLDVSGLEMVDSAGLGMMLAMQQWAEAQGRKLLLRYNDSSFVGSMFRLAKFDTMFEVDQI